MAKTKHMFQNLFFSLMKKPVKIACVVTVGASTTNTVSGRGVESCDRTATGTYKIVLDSLYRKLYGVKITHFKVTVADFTFQVKAETVSTAGEIDFFALTGGVATNLSSGDKLFIELLLNDTDVP